MNRNKLRRAALSVALAGLAASAQAATYITTCQVISQSGAHRVTQNLVASGTCLRIQADRVSIDLGGHQIVGVGTGSAVRADAGTTSLHNPAVRNGSISNFASGVDFRAADAVAIEDLRITNVSGDGIAAGPGSIISRNVVDTVRNNGINVSVTSSTPIALGLAGTIISDNVIHGSGESGISVTQRGSVLRGNAVTRSANVGIFVQCPSAVIGNAAHRNGVAGDRNLVLFGTGCMSSQNSTAQ